VQHERTPKLNRQTPDAHKARGLVRRLLAWFKANARDLPWRRTRDPYAIWISEIMLQQTQVKTVIPYWRRWRRELPTARSLARARPEKVLKLWEGLGYYTRARNLQQAARIIVKEYRGRFPEDFDTVLALPGVGRYTAGAICSIAFNQPTPILDGNVIRVLTRLFGIDGNPRERSTHARLWQLAEALVGEAAEAQLGRARNCSHLNQALMELGATICLPRQPDCLSCPVQRECVAWLKGRVAELPNLGLRLKPTERRFVAFVAERRGRFLVRQRPAGVVNAHLWEFPNVEVNGHASNTRRLARNLLGVCPRSLEPLLRVRHTITRYRVTLDAFHMAFSRATPAALGPGTWCSLDQCRKLAFPSAHRKILATLEKQNSCESRRTARN
jgi:A/G-specific adenine glycosylase